MRKESIVQKTDARTITSIIPAQTSVARTVRAPLPFSPESSSTVCACTLAAFPFQNTTATTDRPPTNSSGGVGNSAFGNLTRFEGAAAGAPRGVKAAVGLVGLGVLFSML